MLQNNQTKKSFLRKLNLEFIGYFSKPITVSYCSIKFTFCFKIDNILTWLENRKKS